MLDESVLESPREKVRATIGNGKPWRDESRAWPDLVAVGEAADRSRVTAGRRT